MLTKMSFPVFATAARGCSIQLQYSKWGWRQGGMRHPPASTVNMWLQLACTRTCLYSIGPCHTRHSNRLHACREDGCLSIPCRAWQEDRSPITTMHTCQ